jgi:hypothetical protein
VPNTSNYGFDYESPTSLPGTTLTGGPTSSLPILAVQVDAALNSLNTAVLNQATTIAGLQASITTNQTNITNLTNWTRTGTILMTFVNVASATTPVSFGFTFPGVPKIAPNIASAGAGTSVWAVKAVDITTTGFTMHAFRTTGVAGSWTDVPVDWIAIYRP